MGHFDFELSSPILICIDSDGCAMDTMTVKHVKCFGPEFVKTFGLAAYEDEALTYWNHINLYSQTRGINRFKGLATVLKEMILRKKMNVKGFSAFEKWTEEAKELSNPALLAECQSKRNPCMEQALLWSIHVNVAITELPKNDNPFPMVKETMDLISREADLVAVSSANGQAVEAEWTKHQLKCDCRTLLCQEDGSKARCIKKLLQKGYNRQFTLMVGDAPGDAVAAKENGVWFFPILVGKETESWKMLQEEAYPKLMSAAFDEEYQEQILQSFYKNLGNM